MKPGSETGTYALILEAPMAATVRVGRLGLLEVSHGFYVYVGSALGPGGLRGRLMHHRGVADCPHWHVDYLRPYVTIREVWFCHDPLRREHEWSALLARARRASVPLSGFGSSDCACDSHLYYFRNPPSLAAFRRRARSLSGSGTRIGRAAGVLS